MQAVALFEGRYVQKLDYVAVGYEIQAFAVAFELVAVLDRHQLVVADEAFLLELDGAAYAGIVAVGPFVRTAEDHGVILPVAGKGVRKGINQLAAVYSFDLGIWGAAETKFIQRNLDILADKLPQGSGVGEYPRVLLLAHDRAESGEAGGPETAHIALVQGRTHFGSDRRQLSRITGDYQLAVHTVAHELEQVFKQISRAEGGGGTLLAVYAYERGLVHYEQGVLELVGTE